MNMNSCNNNKTMFKATKLWNNLVTSFEYSVPCKVHRRKFRCYEKCFTAREAISVMRNILTLTRKDVTRLQAIKLLRKFLSLRIIEDVKGRSGSEDLKDDNRLYRLSKPTLIKPYFTPLPMRQIQKKKMDGVRCKITRSISLSQTSSSPPRTRRYSVSLQR